jgi:hypothetical protein
MEKVTKISESGDDLRVCTICSALYHVVSQHSCHSSWAGALDMPSEPAMAPICPSVFDQEFEPIRERMDTQLLPVFL